MKELYRKLVELSSDGLCLYTLKEGKIVYANRALCNLLELRDTPRTIAGKLLKNVIACPAYEEEVGQKITRHGKVRGAELCIRTAKGNERWVINDSFVFEGPATGKKLVAATFRDVTYRMQIGDALRKSEERFRGIFEGTTDCILVWDKEYNYLYANQAAIDHVGTTRDKVIGRNIRDGLGHIPDFMRLWMKRVDEVFATGKPMRLEDAVPVLGRLVYSESSLSPLRDASGAVFAVGVVYRDVTERKLAEQALRESEEKYRSVVESSIDAIGMYQGDKLIYINKAYCGLFGYREEELLGQSLAKVLAPDYRQRVLQRARRRMRGKGEPSHYLARGRKKNGDDLYIEISASDVFTYRGKPTVLALLRDVTERTRAEEWIEKLNVLKEQLLGTMGLGKKLRLITDRVVEIFGADLARIWMVSRGDLCEKGCFHAAARKGPHVCRDRTRCLHLMASSGRYSRIDGSHRRVPLGCYKIGRVASGEYPEFVTNDVIHDPRIHNRTWARSLGLVSFAGYRLLSSAGRPVGVFALFSKRVITPDQETFLRDVADTSSQVIMAGESEEALRESEEKYRKFIDRAYDAIMVGDVNGHFLEMNRSAEKLLGYNAGELRKMHFTQLHPEEERERIAAAYAHIFQKGAGMVKDMLFLRKDGTTVPVDFSAIAIEVGGKRLVQGIFRDISEQKRLQQMKDNLIRNISHELKTPIATMRMAHEICREAIAAGDMKGVASVQEITARNLRTLSKDVGNILGSYALHLGGMGRSVSMVSLKKIVEEVAANLRWLIEEKGLSLRIQISRGADKIRADERALRTLLYNIMDNAVKFTREGGIKVTARAGGKWIRIRVRDTGCGIAAGDTRDVFSAFFKKDPSMQGTGLGLLICKEVVELYGGTIAVTSAGPKRGTTVVVKLPRGAGRRTG